jgi:hypothetical protein
MASLAHVIRAGIDAVTRWARHLAPGSQQSRTKGDSTREELQQRGLPFFLDVQAEVEQRLEQLTPEARKAFALSCAERLMRWHEARSEEERRPFTLGWRPLLDVLWRGLEGVAPDASHQVQDALDRLHSSPYWHSDGQDGPDDADEDTAAASIYAADCYMSGDAQSAAWAAQRAVQATFQIAEQHLQLYPSDVIPDLSTEPTSLAREAMHPVVQRELQKQLSEMDLLESEGVTRPVLEQLHQGTA